jgi:hypothetical protein
LLAEWTGLEPATPGVTGRYSNQLNYHSVKTYNADVRSFAALDGYPLMRLAALRTQNRLRLVMSVFNAELKPSTHPLNIDN